MMHRPILAALAAAVALSAGAANAENLTMVSVVAGEDLATLRHQLDAYEKVSGNHVEIVSIPSSATDQLGQYKLWLSAGNSDIDVYRTDVIWAPQLADQLVDMTDATKDIIGQHFPSIVQSQTVNGRLVALPWFTDATGLYYRKDLLDKYGFKPPKTWDELASVAKQVQDKERAAGHNDMWGYVFQAAASETLTSDGLEWIKSNGGGQIVEPDGTISVNNPKAIAAIDMVKGFIGSFAPPGVLAYQEEDARGVWQTGNAVFMRNWPYAYPLGNAADSPIKGKFDVTELPAGIDGTSAAALGGWNLAVSNYSRHQTAAIDLVRFLASPEQQKYNALILGHLPTLMALYDDPEIAAKQPIVVRWKNIFLNAVPRPSAPTKSKYGEVAKDFWTAVHNSLSGDGTTADNFKLLERQLKRLKGAGW